MTPLEPTTEASQKSSVVGRVRAGMALIAALSGSRRHSSARPALSQPRCTGRDIHSPKSREVKFSRRDGVRPPVGLRRKGSKPAIASHKNCRRAGVHGKSWWLFRTFQLSVDQLIVLTLQALSALAQVRCVGRTRNIRGGGMTDAFGPNTAHSGDRGGHSDGPILTDCGLRGWLWEGGRKRVGVG